MADRSVRCSLRALRQKAGLQQQDLALRVGASRQAISAIEGGSSVPSTEFALKLAHVLGCRVEEIFSLDRKPGSPEIRAHLASRLSLGAGTPARAGSFRVLLGKVGGRWIAHPLTGEDALTVAADGTATVAARRVGVVAVSQLRDREDLALNVLVAGCDPALAVLGCHVQDQGSRIRLHWIPSPSGDALAALGRGDVHIAGMHSEGSNAASVQRALPGRSFRLVNLATWQEGLAIAPDGRKRIREVGDLARRGVRVLARPRGSGAQALLDRRLKTAGVGLDRLHVVGMASGHLAAARAVAFGLADATIVTRHAAAALGLNFLPLSEERFDLVFPEDESDAPSVRRVLDVLATPAFRRDVGSLPGYGTSDTGRDART